MQNHTRFVACLWAKNTSREAISEGRFAQWQNEKEKKLIGKPTVIFRGTEIGATEAPHLYKKDGYYYLMVAEGGTMYNHGPVLTENLGHYINLYNTWSSYGVESEGIAIFYTAVYGNTEKAVMLLIKSNKLFSNVEPNSK